MAPKRANAQSDDPRFVVAIDFGTTFSKTAYAESPHLEPGFFEIEKMVHLITDWPSQEAAVGTKCFKTKSCVWYMPGTQPGTYELRAWGWEAYVQYKKLVQEQARNGDCATELSESTINSKWTSGGAQSELLPKEHGYLIDCFKLWLYDETLQDLPTGLPLLKVITDFLREMSAHILTELRHKHGRNVNKRNIQWCITIPALWEEYQRQVMEDSAELAGLVQGPSCTDATASLHDLILVLEPEAASIYCHNTLKSLEIGHTFVVVDLGGGTTDLVTHKRIGRTTRSNVRVTEVCESGGGLYGGVHVDERFLEYLRHKIRTPMFECFTEFEKLYPSYVLKMMQDWGSIKAPYAGEVECSTVYELNIPRKLAKSWKLSEKKYCQSKGMDSDRVKKQLRSSYDLLELKSSTVKKMFDMAIDSILSLIKRRDIGSVDFALIVGGFSESPYVRKRIMQEFSPTSADGQIQQEKMSKLVFPRNPVTAVVRGAVALGVLGEWESFVKSRIAKKTYGFDTTVSFNEELHPAEHMVYQEDSKEKHCDHVFQAFIRRGEEVPFNSVVEYNTCPLYREGYPDDDNIVITLYSSPDTNPSFVLDTGVIKEATCVIPVPKAGRKDKQPRLRIRVCFGGTRIRLFVWGTNFSGEKISVPPAGPGGRGVWPGGLGWPGGEGSGGRVIIWPGGRVGWPGGGGPGGRLAVWSAGPVDRAGVGSGLGSGPGGGSQGWGWVGVGWVWSGSSQSGWGIKAEYASNGVFEHTTYNLRPYLISTTQQDSLA
ncbi:unnamed protein product [Calypogeia fissa]